MNILTGTQAVTELIDDDFLYIGRPTVATAQQDKRITKQSLESQIETIAEGTPLSATITTGNTGSLAIGSISTYEGFIIRAMIKSGASGEKRYIVTMGFIYENSTFGWAVLGGFGTLNSGINFKGSSKNLGQGYWDITNTSGDTIYVKYKIINRFEAF